LRAVQRENYPRTRIAEFGGIRTILPRRVLDKSDLSTREKNFRIALEPSRSTHHFTHIPTVASEPPRRKFSGRMVVPHAKDLHENITHHISKIAIPGAPGLRQLGSL
jgi:hypothetical protein